MVGLKGFPYWNIRIPNILGSIIPYNQQPTEVLNTAHVGSGNGKLQTSGNLLVKSLVWALMKAQETSRAKTGGVVNPDAKLSGLVVEPPLWKIWVRKLGWLFPIWKHTKWSKPPTSYTAGIVTYMTGSLKCGKYVGIHMTQHHSFALFLGKSHEESTKLVSKRLKKQRRSGNPASKWLVYG